MAEVKSTIKRLEAMKETQVEKPQRKVHCCTEFSRVPGAE